MMVVGASALVAILSREADGQLYLDKIQDALDRDEPLRVSSVSLWEAAVAIARLNKVSRPQACYDLEAFMRLSNISAAAPDEDITRIAVDASERYGLGNAQGYPGILNMGDCFSYATARYFSARLLCKGDDFPKTDIELA